MARPLSGRHPTVYSEADGKCTARDRSVPPTPPRPAVHTAPRPPARPPLPSSDFASAPRWFSSRTLCFQFSWLTERLLLKRPCCNNMSEIKKWCGRQKRWGGKCLLWTLLPAIGQLNVPPSMISDQDNQMVFQGFPDFLMFIQLKQKSSQMWAQYLPPGVRTVKQQFLIWTGTFYLVHN